MILDLTHISYANRIDNVLWIYFIGDVKPLQLRDEMANAVWKFLNDSSTLVYLETPDSKNAETLTAKGIGAQTNNVSGLDK
ncbi:hypothetical protein [Aulosira sp. FACHB-615]|uniref:hypothetical protein n=1 Tax=Aulosira sp. FACHB-615 TaxID=2692777 RepID=UPI00168A013A|nr:hypothetical protein [Aulosira sp. FACHB-615]MBD2491125.1 hypothetical protein [Aulosira sp. FACHB-615]